MHCCPRCFRPPQLRKMVYYLRFLKFDVCSDVQVVVESAVVLIMFLIVGIKISK